MKLVCFRGRKTSLGSLRPLPSLRPVPGRHEALPWPTATLSLPLCLRQILSPPLMRACAPDGLRRRSFCLSSLNLTAALGRTRYTQSTNGETWVWSRTKPFGGRATRRRQSRDSAEASGLLSRVLSLGRGTPCSVNPTRHKNYRGRACVRAAGCGIRRAAVGAPREPSYNGAEARGCHRAVTSPQGVRQMAEGAGHGAPAPGRHGSRLKLHFQFLV